MIFITIALTAFGYGPQSLGDDQTIVTSITVERQNLNSADMSTARQYARCLSRGFFPVQRNYKAKRGSCRLAMGKHRPSRNVSNGPLGFRGDLNNPNEL